MTENELREKFAAFCRRAVGGDQQAMVAEVSAVAPEDLTCTLIDEGVEYYGVRLQPIVEGKEGLRLLPAVGSIALAIRIEGGDLFVVMSSQYEAIGLKIEDTSLEVTKEGIAVDGGENGGMVKIEPLMQFLQNIYQDLQTLKSLLQTHPVAGNGAPLAMVFQPQTNKPNRQDIENERVKH